MRAADFWILAPSLDHSRNPFVPEMLGRYSVAPNTLWRQTPPAQAATIMCWQHQQVAERTTRARLRCSAEMSKKLRRALSFLAGWGEVHLCA